MKGAAIARRGLLLVLSSPSGAGKTTIGRELLASEPGLSLSVSVTTRPRRPAEREGRDYFFIDETRFRQMAGAAELLEHAEVFGHHYGTPREPVEAALRDGRDVLFDIDWQGAQQLRLAMREDLASVLILPPSTDELARRLRARAQDSEEVVAARMAEAADEIGHWPEYDYVVVNDELDECVAKVRAILAAERLRRRRQTGLAGFVDRLAGGREA